MPRTVISGMLLPLLTTFILAASPAALYAQRELPLEDIRALAHAHALQVISQASARITL